MRKSIGYLIIGVFIGIMVSSSFAIADQPIKLIVDGQEVQFDVAPQIINGTTMVPARPLAEALGASVEWDADNNAVVVTSRTGGNPADLPLVNSNNDVERKPITQNNSAIKETTLKGLRAIEFNGEFYLSLHDECSIYNIEAIWNEDTKTIDFPLYSMSVKLEDIAVGSNLFVYNGTTYIKNSLIENMVASNSNLQEYNNFKNKLRITKVSKPDSYNNITISISYNGSKNEWLSIKQETKDSYGKKFCKDLCKNYTKYNSISINFYYNEVLLGHFGFYNGSASGGFAPYPQNNPNW